MGAEWGGDELEDVLISGGVGVKKVDLRDTHFPCRLLCSVFADRRAGLFSRSASLRPNPL
jgi:hypothetical protein